MGFTPNHVTRVQEKVTNTLANSQESVHQSSVPSAELIQSG